MRKRGGNNRGALIVRQLRGTIAEPLPRRAGKRYRRAWKMDLRAWKMRIGVWKEGVGVWKKDAEAWSRVNGYVG